MINHHDKKIPNISDTALEIIELKKYIKKLEEQRNDLTKIYMESERGEDESD